MYRPRRTRDGHALLVGLEVLAVPASILATLVAVFLGTGAMDGIRYVVGRAGAGGSVADVAAAAGALLVAIAVGSIGAIAVACYRRYVDAYLAAASPAAVVAVPLLGVVGPIGYAAVAGGPGTLPAWLFAVVAVSAAAVAFRTIAIAAASRRERLFVGAATGIPAAVALLAVVDGLLWSGASSRWLLAAVDAAGVPLHRWVLVVVPLLVTVWYGVEAAASADPSIRARIASLRAGGVRSLVGDRGLRRAAKSSPEDASGRSRSGLAA
ncbi:hypothetical protein, partial [Halovivax sp.]|uniref:hypothetical protein n=1 Tax=Halovivax sp. TaxID=1935978 RepID=UPI0025C4A5ED